jgi:hypothetical protein
VARRHGDRDDHDEGVRLDYARGTIDRPPVLRRHVVVGVLAAGAMTVMAVICSIGMEFNRLRLSWVPLVVGVVLINAAACGAVRSPPNRGIAIGLWIGFGIMVLLAGGCFLLPLAFDVR